MQINQKEGFHSPLFFFSSLIVGKFNIHLYIIVAKIQQYYLQ
nr:MAG TPA: hypothetical protein [Caudoviricetes sp.]